MQKPEKPANANKALPSPDRAWFKQQAVVSSLSVPCPSRTRLTLYLD